MSEPDAPEPPDLVTDWMRWLRGHRVAAALIVGGIVVIALGNVTVAVDQLQKLFRSEPSKTEEKVNVAERHGSVTVDLAGLRKRYTASESIHLEVRSDADGFLWIYSPVGGRPNRVFPCPASRKCGAALARGVHRMKAMRWRAIPTDGDPNRMQAGAESGPDEIVAIVTPENDGAEALAVLLEIRPELGVRAVAGPPTDWGGAAFTWDVEP